MSISLKQAAEQALDALLRITDMCDQDGSVIDMHGVEVQAIARSAIEPLRTAIAKSGAAESESVAWEDLKEGDVGGVCDRLLSSDHSSLITIKQSVTALKLREVADKLERGEIRGSAFRRFKADGAHTDIVVGYDHQSHWACTLTARLSYHRPHSDTSMHPKDENKNDG